MSRNRKNNHYHYAEKFDNGSRRYNDGKKAYLPFKALIISLSVLLVFGFVCTTFAAYISENETENAGELSPIISEVRNLKASREVVYTGANADLAGTGYTFTGVSFIFDNTTTNWTENCTYFQFMIGNNSKSRVYTLTHLDGTNLYGINNLNVNDFSDSNQFCIMANASSWGDNDSETVTHRQQYATNRTAVHSMSGNYSGFFTAIGSSAGNDGALHFNYNSTGWSLYNTKQTIQSSTKSTANGNYSNSNAGGTISFSSKEVKSNTETQDSVDQTGYFYAAKTATVTLTATPSNGYRFVGWYDDTNTNQITGAGVSGNTYTYTATADKKVYARFIKIYTVSVQNMSDYTGTAPATTPADGTVDAGGSVTLAASTPQGINFTGWTFDKSSSNYDFVTETVNGNSVTYTADDATCKIIPKGNINNITATANYSLTAPAISSFSYSNSGITTEGSATYLQPDISATSATGSNTNLAIVYSLVSVPTGVTSDDYSFDTSNGEFKANIAGLYTVRVSVTDTAYGLSSNTTTAASATASVPADVTINVRPIAPVRADLSYRIENWTDDYTPGTTGTTHSTPIKVPINSTNFTITMWLTQTNNDYTYNWGNTGGSYDTSTGAVTPITGLNKTGNNLTRIVESCDNSVATGTGSALKVNSDGNYAYVINVYSVRNNVSSAPLTVTIYYDVISDFIDIQWMSFEENSNTWQKIYAEDNGITQLKSSIRVGGSTFNSMTFFSNDNLLYKPVELFGANFPIENSYGTFTAAKPDDQAHNTSAKQETFNVTDIMRYMGTKWIRVYINDTGNNKTASATRYIHTTVGTNSTVSNRPIYYVDSNAIAAVNTDTRVMAFFMLASDNESVVHYQTAQKVSGRENTYRFYIPSDATKITFAHVSTDNYLLPTYDSSNGTLVYAAGSNVLKAWSPTLNLTTAVNKSKNTYKANTYTVTNDIYYYSSTYTDLTTLE